ncbi:hypothetical protein GCM10011360_17350 [Primorskyibacter flagellatus]|uniref:Uncharacterized protein n=1 Tax=Primorskyibacter flagellatus TaxID=1387277 RepID=A0A917EG59_9RHOB|nr:hypothetical protein [Primorskyibacter flagellatus]GGE29825.1 hypothetical protein GCM10011360_17350 [Primorskyibacter flagellatus]
MATAHNPSGGVNLNPIPLVNGERSYEYSPGDVISFSDEMLLTLGNRDADRQFSINGGSAVTQDTYTALDADIFIDLLFGDRSASVTRAFDPENLFTGNGWRIAQHPTEGDEVIFLSVPSAPSAPVVASTGATSVTFV